MQTARQTLITYRRGIERPNADESTPEGGKALTDWIAANLRAVSRRGHLSDDACLDIARRGGAVGKVKVTRTTTNPSKIDYDGAAREIGSDEIELDA